MSRTIFTLVLSISSNVLACGNQLNSDRAHNIAGGDAGMTQSASPAPDASASSRDAASDVIARDAGDRSDVIARDAEGLTGCPLRASTYNQSCTVDTDCVTVGQVLACPATECAFCKTGTINADAAAAYMADFLRATAALGIDAGNCNCAAEGLPCCRAGVCGQCD